MNEAFRRMTASGTIPFAVASSTLAASFPDSSGRYTASWNQFAASTRGLRKEWWS